MVTKVANAPAEAAVVAEDVAAEATKRADKLPLFKPPVVKSIVKVVEDSQAKEEPGEEAKEAQPPPPLPKVDIKPTPADEATPPPPLKPAQPAPAAQPVEPEPELSPPAPKLAAPVPAPREELPPADPLAAPPGVPAPIPMELPLASVSTVIAPRTGRLPLDRAPEWVERKAAESYLFAQVGVVYYWDAPNFCYQPLYFEQPNVERLGYSRCAALQPAISGIHFFAQTLALPYQMTVHPYRRDCIYPLGHYRPGNPAPYRLIYPEWDVKAAAVQAAATTGLIFVLP